MLSASLLIQQLACDNKLCVCLEAATVVKHCISKQSCIKDAQTVSQWNWDLLYTYLTVHYGTNVFRSTSLIPFQYSVYPCGASPPQQLYVARWAAQRGGDGLTVTPLQYLLINNSNTSPLLCLRPSVSPSKCPHPVSAASMNHQGRKSKTKILFLLRQV